MSNRFSGDFFDASKGTEVKSVSDLKQKRGRYKAFSKAADKNGNHGAREQVGAKLAEFKDIGADDFERQTGLDKENYGIFDQLLAFWNLLFPAPVQAKPA